MLKASRSSLSDASAFIRSAGFSSSSCWPSSDRGIKAHVTGVQMFQNIQTETNISQHLSKFSENLEYFFLPNFQTWGYHTKSTEDDILSKKKWSTCKCWSTCCRFGSGGCRNFDLFSSSISPAHSLRDLRGVDCFQAWSWELIQHGRQIPSTTAEVNGFGRGAGCCSTWPHENRSWTNWGKAAKVRGFLRRSPRWLRFGRFGRFGLGFLPTAPTTAAPSGQSFELRSQQLSGRFRRNCRRLSWIWRHRDQRRHLRICAGAILFVVISILSLAHGCIRSCHPLFDDLLNFQCLQGFLFGWAASIPV